MTKYFVVFLVVFGLASCVKNDDHVNGIAFYKIVGTYSGTGETCTYNEFSTDTLCSDAQDNMLGITIPDLQSIRIFATEKLPHDLILNYQQLEIINNQPVHLFQSIMENEVSSLYFYETTSTVNLYIKVNNDAQEFYQFSGSKIK